jgi:hypothetical protein
MVENLNNLSSLSREELIHLLMLKTDVITEYDVLCAKHSALFEQYRELCQKHILFLKEQQKVFNKGDVDSFKFIYHQVEQMKKEIHKVCKQLEKIECEMKQAAS